MIPDSACIVHPTNLNEAKADVIDCGRFEDVHISPANVCFRPIADICGYSIQCCMIDDKSIPGGVVHNLPEDLRDALNRGLAALATWHDITPLARNEWICWIGSAKKAETREKRIRWACESLSEGKRRPCCWPGCPHRH
jgi:hypothetical protein